MIYRIDLNCDLGEYRSIEEERKEIAIMPYLSSTNIACGIHAGDHSSIRSTARRAAEHDLGVGAHPSFPDRDNFGRKAMNLPDDKAANFEVLARCRNFINGQRHTQSSVNTARLILSLLRRRGKGPII